MHSFTVLDNGTVLDMTNLIPLFMDLRVDREKQSTCELSKEYSCN